MTHKSEVLREMALANGWKCEVITDVHFFHESKDLGDVFWHVYAKRNQETIHVVYVGNRLDHGLYKYGEQVVKLWWKNEVVKFLEGKPDPARFHKNSQDRASNGDELVHAVPWEHDSPAIDIMLAVIRKEISWIRAIDGAVKTAVVDVDIKDKTSARHFRVYESKSGRRMLEWADALGFHTVALDQIIDVT